MTFIATSGRDVELRVLGAEMAGDGFGEMGLVVGLFVEADGEGFDRAAESACMMATTVEESMPPERKAPSGTSATICMETASRRRASRAAIASASELWLEGERFAL